MAPQSAKVQVLREVKLPDDTPFEEAIERIHSWRR
jgi:hypothetical protein